MANKANNDWPSKEQIEALQSWKRVHGRNWKSALREAWMSGDYNGIDPHGNTAAYLQQVRNTFGPSWLTRLTLPDAGGFTVQHAYA